MDTNYLNMSPPGVTTRGTSDPKTVFFVNPSTSSSDDLRAQLATFYLWAFKIENTVDKQLGRGADGNVSLEEAWARGSYRAKLVEYLAKNTPWLYQARTDDNNVTVDLEGTYTPDKVTYSRLVRDYILRRTPEIPSDKLSCIESFIAETALMCRPGVTKPVRFALVMPTPINTGENSCADSVGIRIISFLFEMQNGEKQTTVSRSLYECGLDMKLFDQQPIDQVELDAGKAIINRSTVDLIL